MLAPLGAAAILALSSCGPEDRPFLTEVFYDAVGDDSGLEFVEILNPLPSAYSLRGVRLEAGDGSGPGRWTARWTGQPADSIPAHGRFVIGGARVVPAPQALVSLDLQNGPDAVRLSWLDGVVEVVGYGAHEFAEYYCGEPAPDVPAGQSLARIPDGAHQGGNASDFRAAPPTPGRANQPALDAAWVPGSLTLDPEQPGPLETARLSGTIENRGQQALAAGRIRVSARTAERTLLESALDHALVPGDSVRWEGTLAGLPAGKHTLLASLSLDGDEAPENDADSIRVRVGPGPLEITEIQFHPRDAEGEWVEVRNRSGAPLDLAVFSFSDRGAAHGRIRLGPAPCDPDSLALLAQDRAALLGRYPRLDPRRVWQVSPWASLNNTDDASGVADAVVLREEDGTLCERHEYSAAGVPPGVPLERGQGDLWGPASDPEGTPLAPPRLLPAFPGGFEIRPRRIDSGGVTRIGWALPWPRGRIAVELYDLSGSRVAEVVPERLVAGRGEQQWSVGSFPPGLYLLVLRARPESGEGRLGATRLLRVDRAGP